MKLNLPAFVRVTLVSAVVLLAVVSANSPLIIYDSGIYNHDSVKSKYASHHPDATFKTFSEARGLELLKDDQSIQYSLISILSGSSLPLKPITILRYLEAGGSLLWTIDGDSLDGKAENLLQQFGLRSLGTIVDKHAKSSTTNFNPNHALAGHLKKTKIDYKGLGFQIINNTDRRNELIQPLLRAEESARNSGDEQVFGDQILIAATMDTRVGGRILISNESIMKDARVFKVFNQWCKKELGMIRLDSFDHFQGNTDNSEWYIVNGNFGITACLSEFDHQANSFKPIQPKDVQVELKLQHTRQRITLKPSKADSCLHGEMKVPDVYGRYTLLLEYNRPGYPLIQRRRMINVRPQWLDQVPKFVMAALPYYVGWQVQLLITCIMIVPLLWSATRPIAVKTGK